MKRIVEMVGIGDTGPLSGQLTVSPQHIADVALTLLGSQAGTQANDLLQMRDSTGSALACATSAGALYAASIVTPTLTPTTETVGTLYWTSSMSGNGNIVMNDIATVTQTTATCATCATTTRTVGACGVVAATVATAMTVACPASATVLLDVLISSFCTSGAAAGSADVCRVQAVCSSAGRFVSSTTTLLTANPDTSFTPAITTGTAYVGITLAGSAGHLYKFAYDATAVTIA